MSFQISVIVPTRDRPELLAGMLSSLRRSALPHDRFEVIVADNSPTLSAKHAVARFQPSFGRCIHLPVPLPGLHEARHAGLAAATADILVYADDDIVVGERWLSAIGEELADPTVALVGGNNLPRFLAPPPPWLRRLWSIRHHYGQCVEALSILDFGAERRDIPPSFVFGCNFAVRRSAIVAAGGFHPDGFPSEMIRFRGDGETYISTWVKQAGLRARLVPAASVEHLVPPERMTAAYFEKRYFAQGVSDSYSDVRSGTSSFASNSVSAWLRLLRPPSLWSLRLRWHRAYRAGYRFHQAEVAHDSALLAWVRKGTYL